MKTTPESKFENSEPQSMKFPPESCGMSNENLECLGCGVKIGTFKSGLCYAGFGERALHCTITETGHE